MLWWERGSSGAGKRRSLYAGRMLDGIGVDRGLVVDGAVTSNKQTLE